MRALRLPALAALFLFLALPFALQSQAVGSPDAAGITLVLSPTTPPAHGIVEAQLRSLEANLAASRIVWTVNGKAFASGNGLLRIEVPTGPAGAVLDIAALVRLPDGREARILRELRIADADILWSADTSAPPLYAGKRLASPRSPVYIAALPLVFNENGGALGARDLVFQWTLDDEPLRSSSGRGKDAFLLQADTVSGVAHRVLVEVSAVGGAVLARAKAEIPVRQPEVVFYEEHPLLGPRTNRALEAPSIPPTEELDIRAFPLFFALPPNQLLYTWEINGRRVEQKTGQSILSFRPAPDDGGEFAIRASVEGATQRAAAGMLLRVTKPE